MKNGKPGAIPGRKAMAPKELSAYQRIHFMCKPALFMSIFYEIHQENLPIFSTATTAHSRRCNYYNLEERTQ